MIEIAVRKKLNFADGAGWLETDLRIEKGNFTTLYGQSGAGKTSLLRILAGLLTPEEGRIVINERVWLDTAQGINLSPQQRKAGFLFQDYALFPHMTVKENLNFALAKKQDRKIVSELIEVAELSGLQHQKPKTLSGGQQQRVALARALVQNPDLLMLDEPLSALDEKMRATLQHYILDMHQQFGLTTLLVSHDVSEILKMSNQVVLLENGRVVEVGEPERVLRNKLAPMLTFTGQIERIQRLDDQLEISVSNGDNHLQIFVPPSMTSALKIGDRIRVQTRAHIQSLEKL